MPINPITLESISDSDFAILRQITSKYLNISPDGSSFSLIPNTCADLDRDAKQILNKLNELRKIQDSQTQIDFLMFANKLVLNKFNQYSCRNRIEDTRVDNAGIENTKYAIKSEQSVLGKSNSQANVYLIIGGVVILSSLLILLGNKK
jgi:hypothetical protein